MVRSKKIKRIKTKKKYSKRKTISRKNKSLKGGMHYLKEVPAGFVRNVGEGIKQIDHDLDDYPMLRTMATAGAGAVTASGTGTLGAAPMLAAAGITGPAALGAGALAGGLASLGYLYSKSYPTEGDALSPEDLEYYENMRNKIIRRYPLFLDSEGCENKKIQEATLSRWKSKFDNNWTDLYKNNPIIVIYAHGSLTYGKEDDYYFKIPSETQLIAFERSGSIGIAGTSRYPTKDVRWDGKLHGVELGSDLINTCMNPNDKNLYLLEDDGITRKQPFLYTPLNTNKKTDAQIITTSCQKLYREGDTINNIFYQFKDRYGAFNQRGINTPDPSEKSILPFHIHNMAGIYVFNSDISLEKFYSNLEIKYKEYSEEIKISEDLNYNEKLYNLTLLIRLLYGSHNVKKLPSNNDKFNYKFNLNDGNTTLREVMNLFGKGTYYNMSCKSLRRNDDGSRTRLDSPDVELVRNISSSGEPQPDIVQDFSDEVGPSVSSRWTGLESELDEPD